MNYDGKKLCGVPDHFGGAECLWPFLDVQIHASGKLGAVNIEEAVAQAINGWNTVCGIHLQLSANPRTAHIILTQGMIDGPARTLGWSELPCGFSPTQWRQLKQQYDTGEVWVTSENPPQNKVDAVRVICHEVGHAIGISHINDGNLMAPTYSARIRWPQRGDVAEGRARYGLPATPAPTPVPPPVTPPTPPPVPLPGGGDIWSKLLPCLLDYGIDLAKELTPDERAFVLRWGIDILRALTPEQRERLQRLRKE